MKADERFALFVMLGQSADRELGAQTETVPPESLPISATYDLAPVMPAEVKKAIAASTVYKLFFVFENFLRELVLSTLAEKDKENWWSKVPANVREDVEDLEKKEETKAWMSLGTRDKLSLTTYNQVLQIIDECWKEGFQDVIRDKSLIQEARHIAHLRNAICHMTDVPGEEIERIRQVIRDWFRIVSP